MTEAEQAEMEQTEVLVNRIFHAGHSGSGVELSVAEVVLLCDQFARLWLGAAAYDAITGDDADEILEGMMDDILGPEEAVN
jgi:hypothetical protein